MLRKKRFKRGSVTHESLYTLFEVLVFLFYAYIMYSFVSDINKSTLFEKNYLARDISMVTNTIYASPQHVSYYYPENISRFQVNIKANKVRIKDAGQEGEDVEKIYWFADDYYLRLRLKDPIRDVETFKIFKSQNDTGDYFKLEGVAVMQQLPEVQPQKTKVTNP